MGRLRLLIFDHGTKFGAKILLKLWPQNEIQDGVGHKSETI